MIRKTLLAAATAIVLGAGFVGVGSIAAPSEAQAQWRDYDRPSYGQRRYNRERAYRPQRQEFGRQGSRGSYAAPRGGGGGAGYGYRPGQVLPGGQTYTTPGGPRPNAQQQNGYN